MRSIIKFSATLLLLLFSFSIYAQIDLKKKIKTQSVNRANKRTDQGVSKGLDAVEGGIKGAFPKKDKSQTEETQSEKSGNQKDSNTQKSDSSQPNEATPKTEETTTFANYSKYDFIPGEKIIFFDDFSQDAVGDFPALWNTNASGEVMTTNLVPGHWFKIMNNGFYTTISPLDLGENFTVEFDVIPQPKPNAKTGDFIFEIFSDPKNSIAGLVPGNGGVHITLSSSNHKFSNYLNDSKLDKDGSFIKLSGNSTNSLLSINKKSRVSIWVQKRRLRVYHEQTKIFDLPTAMPANMKFNRLRFMIWDRPGEPLISNLRVATGAPDTRNKLLTEGRLVTYGILFDTGSDKIKPESYGTLKSITDVLKENSDVKVKVIGHTDADGDAAKNLDLSKRRAASVKNELIKSFGIDGSRIETDGKGKTEPIVSNDTPANKAQNRRVEFIKL